MGCGSKRVLLLFAIAFSKQLIVTLLIPVHTLIRYTHCLMDVTFPAVIVQSQSKADTLWRFRNLPQLFYARFKLFFRNIRCDD